VRDQIWLTVRMTLASPWYSTSSALFWLTVALLAIAIVTLVVIILTWRSSSLRRRILCSTIWRSHMLSAPKPIKDDLNISYQDKKLEDPYVTTIEISNVGRAPILSEDYTQSRSLQFQLAAPIVTVLSVEHRPESAPPPSIFATGNTFELKPELLVKEEIIRTALLTEGPPGDVRVSLNPFGAIEVLVRDRQAWLQQRIRRRTIGGIVALGSLLTILIALLVAGIISTNNAQRNYNSATSASYCSTLIQDVGLSQLSVGLADESVIVTRNSSGSITAIKRLSIYSTSVNSALQELRVLAKDEQSAATNGVDLGSSAQALILAQNAVQAFAQLPQEGISSAAQNSLVLMNRASNILKGQQAIPKQCQL
jgi:hypothetical protein